MLSFTTENVRFFNLTKLNRHLINHEFLFLNMYDEMDEMGRLASDLNAMEGEAMLTTRPKLGDTVILTMFSAPMMVNRLGLHLLRLQVGHSKGLGQQRQLNLRA